MEAKIKADEDEGKDAALREYQQKAKKKEHRDELAELVSEQENAKSDLNDESTAAFE